jgi:hypothetical protein
VKNEKYANGKNMEVVKMESGINLATFFLIEPVILPFIFFFPFPLPLKAQCRHGEVESTNQKQRRNLCKL